MPISCSSSTTTTRCARPDDPLLRPWAIGWLVARGDEQPDTLTAADATAGFVQALAVALTAGGPDAVTEMLAHDTPVHEQTAIIDQLWRVDDPIPPPCSRRWPRRRIARSPRRPARPCSNTAVPGSACSVSFGIGITAAEPGSVQGLHLVVQDIAAAHAELTERGADVSAIRHMTPEGWKSGPDPEHARFNSFAGFADPDGNTWILQEVDYEPVTA